MSGTAKIAPDGDNAPEGQPVQHISLSQKQIDNIVSLEREVCADGLKEVGGLDNLLKVLEVNPAFGLSSTQVQERREQFGMNQFPESPLKTYTELLCEAMEDPTLLVLLAAAGVSMVVGIIEEGAEKGWIEGGAIFIAVALVSNITALNDYQKQMQFAALEATADADKRCTVRRDGHMEEINPIDCVVGDIVVLQAGDDIPTDSLMLDDNTIMSSQAALTGESDDLKKNKKKDFMIYSSCLVTEADDKFNVLCLGIGVNSQWGKIKASIEVEHQDTPLQEKLNNMTDLIGRIGMFFSALTFIALIISIWTRDNGEHVAKGVIHAFILAVTIIVVAIPEGLPLAVTIALAYSTKEMYKDQCFIRHLAACETMGNATNICSDKTGTLTENRMTVVTGWFSGKYYSEEEFDSVLATSLPENSKVCISDQCSINRVAYLVDRDADGNPLPGPKVIGNKTEGALIMMAKKWGIDYEEIEKTKFKASPMNKIFAFNSAKKRSTAVVEQADGSVRLFVKGASEWVMKDVTKWMDEHGQSQPMTDAKMKELNDTIMSMASNALRTLALGHRDFPNKSSLPQNWEESPPDHEELTIDCIVGIIDPLRSDVKEAVRTAQEAGVVVRMITGDNIATAKAIARQCGILTDDGTAIEGPVFRKLTPAQADEQLKHIQVMARSSPEDKHLLVTRLNGGAVPADKEAWEKLLKKGDPSMSWDEHKDVVLPGYREEWEAAHPEGGQVVGVTGDGTNDAPALTAADVGLAMGITGTKVAQGAADIVILDDKFSSIVRAILWGRCVFDNIRKFLQFQITVNIVALLLVFIGAAAGFGQPLTAVQMLWVNLIMDTMGALALGTEKPVPELLQRRPYKRDAPLISWPMWRNIFSQAAYQLALLFWLLFAGAKIFDVNDMSNDPCFKYEVTSGNSDDSHTANGVTITCSHWTEACAGEGTECYEASNTVPSLGVDITFSDYSDFAEECLTCVKTDYTHGTIIFNAFIWCQIFNEYTARSIFDEWNCLKGISTNPMFLFVSIASVALQILIVQVGEDFTSTSPLTTDQWGWTILFGLLSMPIGVAMRFIPPHDEDPSTFFAADDVDMASEKAAVVKPSDPRAEE